MPTGQAHLDFALSALCGLGGMMAFMKKKSLPSLLGGLGFSVAYAASGHYIQNVDAAIGHQAGAFTSLALGTMMGARFIKTKKVMPAGVLASAGILALVYHFNKWQQWRE